MRAVIGDAPEPNARRATVKQGPVAHEVQIPDPPQAQRSTRGFIGAPAGNTPPAASSGSQTVRSNVPLPTGEEETVMDRLARDALANQRQQAARAVQEAFGASPRGHYEQLKHQPLQLKYTDEWHQQSQQTEQGDVPATNNTRTNVHLQVTKGEVEGLVSSLNNRPMGSPTADSPLLRPADTSPVPNPKTPNVPHSMPTLGDSAREERSVPQTPVQQTPVQSAQAQLDSAQPTTPARPSPDRAAYVLQYTTKNKVKSKIAEAIRDLEEDRQKRVAQHATQEHSTTPQPQRTRTYRHSVHDNLKKRAQVLNNTLLGQNSPATPQRGGAMPVAPLVAAANVRTQTPVPPAQTPATSTNLGVEPAAPMSSITRRPKPTFTRRPPTARRTSAPTTPDADAAVDPQTPVAPRVATPQADSSKPTSPAAAVTPAPSSPAKNPVISSESPRNKGKNKQGRRKQQQQKGGKKKGGKKKDLTTPGTGFSIIEPTFQPRK